MNADIGRPLGAIINVRIIESAARRSGVAAGDEIRRILRFSRLVTWSRSAKALAASAVMLLASCAPDHAARNTVEIVVGLAGPLTGGDAVSGEQMRRGAELALADINAAGGLLGRKLKLEIADDQCDTNLALPVANSLVAKNVVFVAGHYCSGVSIRASAVYVENNILQITPASTNPRLTDGAKEKGWRTVFRTCGRDDIQGVVAGRFLASQYKGKKVAILHDRTPYGQGIADETKKHANAGDLKVALYDSFEKGDKDFAALVGKMKQMGIDAVYVGSYPTETGLLVRQAREQGLGAQFVSEAALASDRFWKIAGPAGEGLVMTDQPDPNANPEAKTVVEKLTEQGHKPEGYTLYSYAAFQVYAAAVTAAGSLDPQKVAAEIHGKMFDTVLGPLQYDDKGDVINSEWVWYKWHDGQFARIKS